MQSTSKLWIHHSPVTSQSVLKQLGEHGVSVRNHHLLLSHRQVRQSLSTWTDNTVYSGASDDMPVWWKTIASVRPCHLCSVINSLFFFRLSVYMKPWPNTTPLCTHETLTKHHLSLYTWNPDQTQPLSALCTWNPDQTPPLSVYNKLWPNTTPLCIHQTLTKHHFSLYTLNPDQPLLSAYMKPWPNTNPLCIYETPHQTSPLSVYMKPCPPPPHPLYTWNPDQTSPHSVYMKSLTKHHPSLYTWNTWPNTTPLCIHETPNRHHPSLYTWNPWPNTTPLCLHETPDQTPPLSVYVKP